MKNSVKITIGVGFIIALIVWAVLTVEIVKTPPIEIEPAPHFTFSDFDTYGGQIECGNTNMIYAEIVVYDRSVKHLVRVNKNNVFSFEREFESREMAIDYMVRYEQFLRVEQ